MRLDVVWGVVAQAPLPRAQCRAEQKDAGGGIRTHTPKGQRILSAPRLPAPPLRLHARRYAHRVLPTRAVYTRRDGLSNSPPEKRCMASALARPQGAAGPSSYGFFAGPRLLRYNQPHARPSTAGRRENDDNGVERVPRRGRGRLPALELLHDGRAGTDRLGPEGRSARL